MPDRPYQLETQRLLWASDRLAPNAVVKPTGAGKTRTIASFLKNYVLPQSSDIVYIVCHQDPLPSQWMAALIGAGIPLDLIGAIVSNDTKQTMPAAARKYCGLRAGVRIVIVMAPSLPNKLGKIPAALLPDILIQDEAHLTSEVSQKSINALIVLVKAFKPLWIIGVTATPAFHPSNSFTFDSIYPKDRWIITITPAELQAQNYWKRVVSVEPSIDYGLEAERRFAGLDIQADGEISDTSQSAVMRSLLTHQIDEWEKAQTIPGQPALFSCVDRLHAKSIDAELKARGYTSQAVYTKGKDKQGNTFEEISTQDACDAINSGRVQCTVVVGKLQAGADLTPICQQFWIVICKIYGSAANREQVMGRGTRPCEFAPGQWATLQILDLGRNDAEHGLPFQIDWTHYVQSRRMFSDPDLRRCQNSACNHYHKSNVPKPLHPTDRKISGSTKSGLWDKGGAIDLNTPLVCHGCGKGVTYDHDRLKLYADWQKACRTAIIQGDIMPRPSARLKKNGAGVSIAGDYPTPLTPGIMQDLELWELEAGEGSTPQELVDRSKDWANRQVEITLLRGALATRSARVAALPEGQRYLDLKSLAQCKEGLMHDCDRTGMTMLQAIRRAFVVSFIRGYQPSAVFTVFPLSWHDRYKEKGELYNKGCYEAIDLIAKTEDGRSELAGWLGSKLLEVEEAPGKGQALKVKFLKRAIAHVAGLEEAIK